MNKQSDNELIKKVKAGGEEGRRALTTLYDRYKYYVQGQAQRFIPNLPSDIDDFCNEVWIRTIKAIPNFRGDSLRALLGRAYWGGGSPEGVIGHYSVEFLRKKTDWVSLDKEMGKDKDGKSVYFKDTLIDGIDNLSKGESIYDKQQKEQRKAIVRDEIIKLPRAYSYIIFLSYWQKLTARQISQMLDISEDAVWWRLSEARKKLMKPLARRLNLRPKNRKER